MLIESTKQCNYVNGLGCNFDFLILPKVKSTFNVIDFKKSNRVSRQRIFVKERGCYHTIDTFVLYRRNTHGRTKNEGQLYPIHLRSLYLIPIRYSISVAAVAYSQRAHTPPSSNSSKRYTQDLKFLLINIARLE